MADLPSQSPTPDIPPEFKSGTLRISMPRSAKPAPGGLFAKKISSAATTLPIDVPPAAEAKPSAVPHAVVVPQSAKVYVEGDLFKEAPAGDSEPLMPVPFNKSAPSVTESGALPKLNSPRVSVFPLNGKNGHENGHANGHTNGTSVTKKEEPEVSREPQFPTQTISPAGRLTEPLPPIDKKDTGLFREPAAATPSPAPLTPAAGTSVSEFKPPVTGKLVKPQISPSDLRATTTVPKVTPSSKPVPEPAKKAESGTLKIPAPPLQVTKTPFDPGINPTVIMNPPITASATSPVPIIKPPKPDLAKAPLKTQELPVTALSGKTPLSTPSAPVKPEAMTVVLPPKGKAENESPVAVPAVPVPAPAPKQMAPPPVIPSVAVKPPAPVSSSGALKPVNPTRVTPAAPAAVKKSATLEIKGAPPKETARITLKPALPNPVAKAAPTPIAPVAAVAAAAVAGAAVAAVKPVAATKPSPGPTPLGSVAPRPKTSVVVAPSAAVKPGGTPAAVVKPVSPSPAAVKPGGVPPSTSGTPTKTQAISSPAAPKASPAPAAAPRAGAGTLPSTTAPAAVKPAAAASKPATTPAVTKPAVHVTEEEAPSTLVTVLMGIIALLIWGTSVALLASVQGYF